MLMIHYYSHETSAAPKFSQQFPEWKTKKNVAGKFVDYGESFQNHLEEDSSNEEESEKKTLAKYPWAQVDFYVLEPTDDTYNGWNGYPILPEVPLKSGQEYVGGLKILIRSFVKEVLSAFGQSQMQ
jgi:hypothetical protein